MRLTEHEDADFRRAARGFTTRAVHAGERPERPEFTPTVTPIYPSVSYLADDPETQDAVFGGEQPGYVYTRHGNPTTRALEVAVAALEETEDAIAFGSGMAALLAAILNEVQAGDRVVASRDLYGATQALLGNVFGTLGVRTTYVDIRDLDAVERVLAEVRPRVLLFETISNPLVRVADISALVEIARRNRVKTIVDNTFATPLLINPARFGVDTVVHSTTKYLGGHGDATGGVAVARETEGWEKLLAARATVGGVLSVFEAHEIMRGVKTLGVRMERQCANARQLAERLSDNPRIGRVHHPGLGSTNGRSSVVRRVLRAPHTGALVSIRLADDTREAAFRFMDNLKLCVRLTSLGDVLTSVSHPATSSHRSLTPEHRREMGITESLVRISVGIEDAEDIIRDVEQALEA